MDNILELGINLISNQLNKLPKYQFEIGVISEDSNRTIETKVSIGVTNAELMFIHENGSPLQKIPSRPVLQMTIDYVKSEWLQKGIRNAIYKYIQNNFSIKEYEKELNKWAIRIENYARDIIYSNDGRLSPNAPSTIARKGDNHPLFDTGQLARSITCRLVKL